MDTKQFDKALEQYLLADKAITDRSPTSGRSVNMSIGYCYEALGNKAKAKEYYQKELERIKSNATYASQNTDFIQSLEKRIRNL
jgi:tetratricopeptide (TPR) repeat protein